MAASIEQFIIAKKATNASVTQYGIVKKGADDEHVTICSAASDKAVGIIQSATATAAEDVMEVAVYGGAYLKLGSGGATWGDKLTSDGSGHGIVASDQNVVIAVAMATGVENDVIPVLMVPAVL